MSDILKSAQKQIDEAANQVLPGTATSQNNQQGSPDQSVGTLRSSTPPSDTPLLKDEALIAAPNTKKDVPLPTDLSHDASTPPRDLPQATAPDDSSPSVQDDSSPVAPTPPHDTDTLMPQEPPPTPPSASAGGKHHKKSIALLVVLLLLATLPLSVYFISLQQQLADVRSRATNGPYPTVPPATCSGTCVPSTLECRDGNGSAGSGTCSPGRYCCNFGSGSNTPTPGGGLPNNSGVCGEQGRDCNGSSCTGHVTINVCENGPTGGGPCDHDPGRGGSGPICNNPIDTKDGTFDCIEIANQRCAFVQIDTPNGSGVTCYPTDRSHCGGSPSPTQSTNPTSSPAPTSPPGGESSPTPPGGGGEPTPLPTSPPSGPQCKNIKVYKDGQEVDPSTLKPGDAIAIAVKGNNSSKARVRVNGAAWEETDKKNGTGEYTVDFTIPTDRSSFTVEAEVYKNGVWN